MSGRRAAPAVSLLFAAGERPDAGAVAVLATSGSNFSISHDPGGQGLVSAPRWLELLSNGMTFDIDGLAGGPASPPPPSGHRIGLPAGLDGERLRAVTLRPGKHLVAGGTMLPVLRTLARVAAHLTELRGVHAVSWHPARSMFHPRQFRDAVLNWIQGDAFPALFLAALAPVPDGGLQSEGLLLFTGQELRLEPELTGDRAEAGKLAVSLLHWLYEHGEVTATEHVTPSPDVRVRLEPSGNGRFVRAWKA